MPQSFSTQDFSRATPIEAVNTFVARVYSWMGVGLGITAAVAMVVAHSPAAIAVVYGNPLILIGLIVAQLGAVIAIGAVARRANAAVATGLFLLYAALLGVTLSSILLVYTETSIASTFFVSGGMFGAMSLYGYATKKDLTSIGNLCFMGLIGIILASIVNIFVGSNMMGWIISYLGVAIFLGLTAYDTQKVKNMAAAISEGGAPENGLAILGALALYLDFVNLFLFLLRIFGKRR
jgi:FtsH-binding integral membrane protein